MKRIDIADIDTLNHLYNEMELSAQKIADMYSTSKQVVLRNLERCNIGRRGATELKVRNKRILHCEYCGDEITSTRSKRPHIWHVFCSNDCKCRWMSDTFSGPDSWNWKGGSRRIDYGYNWQRNKKQALARDAYTCQGCGTAENVEVHHLVPFTMFRCDRSNLGCYDAANDVSNLLTLCKRCHGRVRSRKASETIMVASEYVLSRSQMMEWSELHGDMQSLAEMTKTLIR